MYTDNNNTFPENKEIMNSLKTDDTVKRYMKKLMPFVAHLKVKVYFLIRISLSPINRLFIKSNLAGCMSMYLKENFQLLVLYFTL